MFVMLFLVFFGGARKDLFKGQIETRSHSFVLIYKWRTDSHSKFFKPC